MSKKARAIRLLHQWHRGIGVSVALFLLLLAVSGLLLNHTSELELAKRPVTQSWLLDWYAIEAPELTEVEVNGRRFIHDGLSKLAIVTDDSTVLHTCNRKLLGAVATPHGLLVLCQDSLLWLSAEAQLIERLSQFDGLPAAQALAYFEQKLWFKLDKEAVLFDLDRVAVMDRVVSADETMTISWSQVERTTYGGLPEQLRAEFATGLNWQRLLQDLHSGRVLGQFGVLLMDAVAILMVYLAVSGLWIWGWRQRKRR